MQGLSSLTQVRRTLAVCADLWRSRPDGQRDSNLERRLEVTSSLLADRSSHHAGVWTRNAAMLGSPTGA